MFQSRKDSGKFIITIDPSTIFLSKFLDLNYGVSNYPLSEFNINSNDLIILDDQCEVLFYYDIKNSLILIIKILDKL
jgi:hypothetical protein